eukprot:g2232.t1
MPPKASKRGFFAGIMSSRHAKHFEPEDSRGVDTTHGSGSAGGGESASAGEGGDSGAASAPASAAANVEKDAPSAGPSTQADSNGRATTSTERVDGASAHPRSIEEAMAIAGNEMSEDALNELREGRSSKRQIRVYRQLMRKARLKKRRDHLERMDNFYASEDPKIGFSLYSHKRSGRFLGRRSEKLYEAIADARTFDEYHRPIRIKKAKDLAAEKMKAKLEAQQDALLGTDAADSKGADAAEDVEQDAEQLAAQAEVAALIKQREDREAKEAEAKREAQEVAKARKESVLATEQFSAGAADALSTRAGGGGKVGGRKGGITRHELVTIGWKPEQFAPPGLAPPPERVKNSEGNERFYNYYGKWRHGLMEGKGVYTFADGYKYDGEFLRNKRAGYGEAKYPNGAHYEGQWQENMYHGDGVLKQPSGSVYEGQFKSGKRHGYGRLTYASGQVYEGTFACGVVHGRGVMTGSNRAPFEYRGTFQNGRIEGSGMVIFKKSHWLFRRGKLKEQLVRDMGIKHGKDVGWGIVRVWPRLTFQELVALVMEEEIEYWEDKRWAMEDAQEILREEELIEYVAAVRADIAERKQQEKDAAEEEKKEIMAERRKKLQEARRQAMEEAGEEWESTDDEEDGSVDGKVGAANRGSGSESESDKK